MNIAIVDDDLKDINYLRKFFLKYSEEKKVSFQIYTFHDVVTFLDSFVSKKYDILFLDIDMPCYNGMELARKVRNIDTHVPIIFITNMAQYAIEGYLVQAYRFMIKPVVYMDFSTMLDSIIPKIQADKLVESVEIVSAGQLIRIPTRDITYVEIMGHKAIYHLVDREFSSWESMKSVKKKLEQYQFELCNACYLVNFHYVNAVKGFSVFLTDGTELAISQSRKKHFMQRLSGFLGGNL